MMATVPLFTVPVAAVWLRDRVSRRQGAGLVVGFVGVALLVGLGPVPMTPALAAAVVALLAAASFYALGGVYTARRFSGASPLESTIGQQFATFALLLPFTLVALPQSWPSREATVALLILALFPSAVAYLFYFRLITRVGPVNTATVSYLIPLFGTVWGALILREPVGLATLLGMAVILAGVLLATGPLPARPRRWLPSKSRSREVEESRSSR
jgi:drug/metabolite transporter (DMT)-like permease